MCEYRLCLCCSVHLSGASRSLTTMSGSPTMEPTAYDASIPIAVQAQENKRRKRRIMKIAVYVMFGIIALGVFAIWLFHKDAIESIRFDANFIFTVKVQTLEIKTDDQEGLLYGELGRNIKAAPFYSCWDAEAAKYEENCLYWSNKAFLRVSHDHNVTSSCYTLSWQGLEMGFVAEDCFYLQKYHWFGYLLPDHPFWPIDNVRVKDVPYYSQYPEQQAVSLAPSWLGAQGIAIFVHSSFPFSLSWNHTDKRQFCIASQVEVLENYKEEDGGVNQLTYTICRGSDLRDVFYNTQEHRHSWEVELKKTPHTIQPLAAPLHSIETDADIMPLLTSLRDRRLRCSFVQLPMTWESRFGDLQFNETLLQKLLGLMTVGRERACSMLLPISTFFTFNSRLFQEGIHNHYFLRDELNLVTKMVQWRDREGAVLDLTNQEAVHWYLDHVKLLLHNASYNIRAVKLLHIDVPRDANFFDSNMTFLDYSRLFYRDASMLLNVTLILEKATGFVSEPVFVSLDTEIQEVEGAQCFNTVIPWALNLGVSGYPLIVMDGSQLHSHPEVSVQLVERWLQLAVFFPGFQLPKLRVLEMGDLMGYVDLLMGWRAEILTYMREQWAMDREAPILRPLWWRNPKDPVAQRITDQFLVGERLLVAPIVCHPATHRNVYLPSGSWQAANYDNNTYVGPKTVRIGNIQSKITVFFWEVSD